MNKKKLSFLFVLILLLTLFLSMSKVQGSANIYSHEVIYEWDMIPDSSTAVKIAEIILKRTFDSLIIVHGAVPIEKQKPFKVNFIKKKNIWIVSGDDKKDVLGGTAYVRLDKKTAKVLHIGFGK